MNSAEDETVCNDEKLESGSTAAYIRSCKHFLDWVVFQDEEDWPSLIMAPSNMVDKDTNPNVPIEVSDHCTLSFRCTSFAHRMMSYTGMKG